MASYWRISKGALPRIIHCSAGKDRPGMAVALLLSALDAIDGDWGGMAPYLDGIGVTAPVVARLRADLLEKMEGQRL
ncbi:tyrosine-protein phosphatase [uncultured Sphingobium sp.]|uniref:tyrosine-protein phosphatase n=1 Tax=uncultured Sphingobium sp. TaxID=316087 RepID=UPI00262A2C3D|nr:tyrosine-protein phosphatase [uncultured Sphingobium sp.]